MIKIIHGHWNNNSFSAELYLSNEDLIIIPLSEVSDLPKTYISMWGILYYSIMEDQAIIGFKKINQVINKVYPL